MSNLKTLLFPADFIQKFDLADYPNMTLHEYSNLDMKLTQKASEVVAVLPFVKVVLKPKKQKHVSAVRTVSDGKWAGRKRNKPKHNWGKKRKALMKVWLG